MQSYKDLPKLLYHIQWKFRDELRPRFGVMRGREFLMKDNYSFDLDAESARRSYDKVFVSYLRTFSRLGLRAVPMEADTGPIGGNLSHEFIVLAETGESRVWCDRALLETDILSLAVDYEDPEGVADLVSRFTGGYACSDDKHDPALFAREVAEERRYEGRGIEVGHIFYFGDKYAEPLGAKVLKENGEQAALHMGSYGIGITRLVGALIEAFHDEHGIIWPDAAAPFHAALLNLRQGDAACDAFCERLYAALLAAGVETLYDDRDERAGAKFSEADLVGLPWRIVVGPKTAAAGRAEIRRRDGRAQEEELALEDVVARLKETAAAAAAAGRLGAVGAVGAPARPADA